MNGETITLIIYGSIALLLAVGGIYSLRMGFKLIAAGRGKTPEASSVNFLGLKVTTGSIGSLVMMTAFMWGWAAKLSLPQYNDGQTQITALTQKLAVVSTQHNKLKIDHIEMQSELVKQKAHYVTFAKAVETNNSKLSHVFTSDNTIRTLSTSDKDNIKALLDKQAIDINKFKSVLGNGQ